MCVEYTPVLQFTWNVGPWGRPCRQQSMTLKTSVRNLCLWNLEPTLSQNMLIPLSLFDVWGHLRVLCSSTHLRNIPAATRPFLCIIVDIYTSTTHALYTVSTVYTYVVFPCKFISNTPLKIETDCSNFKKS